MGYRLELEIPAVPRLENRVSKAHWATEHKRRKAWRELVVLAVGKRAPKKPLAHARVVIDVWRRGIEPDPVNLLHSMKPVIDGMLPTRSYRRGKKLVFQRGAGVLQDDRADNFAGGCYSCRLHRIERGDLPRIKVTIEEIAPCT